MVMVDTSVWIDYFNGKISPQTNKLEELLAIEIVVLGDIILAETLRGFREDSHFMRAKMVLDDLDCFSITNKNLAKKSAENYRYLRKMGITVRKTTNRLIGTFCIEHQMPLLYCTRDFDPLRDYLGLRSVL